MKRDVIGCDWCYWTFGIFPDNRGQRPDLKANGQKDSGAYVFELTCQYDPRSSSKSQMCVDYVRGVQTKMDSVADREGLKLRQYYNTPSCRDEKDTPFQER